MDFDQNAPTSEIQAIRKMVSIRAAAVTKAPIFIAIGIGHFRRI